MNIQQQHNEKGFTIIEVVLVLAIAGLIFLMVFIALPALQRSQRDTARKQDVGTVSAAVTSYTSNNRGQFPAASTITLPATGATGIGGYFGDLSDNITQVQVRAAGTGSVTAGDGIIVVTPKTQCGTSSTTSETLTAGTTRQFTTVTKLEAGNGAYFCQNS